MRKLFTITFCLACITFSSSNLFAQFRQIHNAGDLDNDIKGMSFLNPSTGFIAFTKYIAFTQDSGRTYIQRPITVGNTNFNGYSVNTLLNFVPSGVAAFSTDSLITFGNFTAGPCILFSADQGLTWKMVYHSAATTDLYNRIFDVKFNGSVGTAVQHDKILRSTNKGQSWSISAYGSVFEKINYPSSSVGYATAKYLLLKTTNGGQTWNSINVPVSNSNYNYDNVFFVTNSIGYLTESTTSTIYRTGNGGTSWTKMNNEALVPVNGSDIVFINDSTGFICKTNSFDIFKTSDSGKIWEPCKKEVQYQYLGYGFNKMQFLNSQTAWAGGAGEYLMLTTNGTPVKPKAFFRIDTLRVNLGTTVNLTNLSKRNYQYKWFKNDTLISTSYNVSYTHLGYPLSDVIKLVVDNGVETDTAILGQQFPAPEPAAIVISAIPMSGNRQTVVDIYGSNFTYATGVSFGGVPAFYFQVFTDTHIYAMVGINGGTGDISVTRNYAPTGSLPGFTFYPTPVINSILPLIAQIGSTVTISGSNFNSSIAGNTVYFGSVKATVLSATTNTLTVTVPFRASYGHISVTCNTLTAFSPKPFLPTFAGGTIAAATYTTALNLPSGTMPKNIATGDFDGDGNIDLVAANKNSNTITVYKNTSSNGNINFATAILFSTGGSSNATSRVITSDVDGDGKLDIIVTYLLGYSGNVDIFRNTSSSGVISFAAKVSFSTSTNFNYFNAESIASGDFDGDGKIDIAIGNLYDHNVNLYLNKSSLGNISFGGGYSFQTDGNSPSCIGLKDIDGDGKLDLVVSNQGGLFSVYLNQSNYLTNTVSALRVDFTGPTNPKYLSFADIDGDGNSDIVVTDFSGGKLFMYRNLSTSGNISLAAHVDLVCGTSPTGTSVGDLDGDGKIDIAVSNTGSNNISVFKNLSILGSVSFAPKVDYVVGNGPEGNAICDLNGDSQPEIVSANSISNDISILKKSISQGLTLCPHTTATTITNASIGTLYQWQIDTGTGFNDLTNNSTYSGATTNTLQLNNIDNNWYGYKFRCVIDGNPVISSTLKFTNTWTGAVSNLWENPANWSCGVVPQSTTDVYINSGTVIISSNTAIGSLHVITGVNFIVNAGVSLIITH
jgi:photosystem II stability/assembly factor-like uncharacterized protein